MKNQIRSQYAVCFSGDSVSVGVSRQATRDVHPNVSSAGHNLQLSMEIIQSINRSPGGMTLDQVLQECWRTLEQRRADARLCAG